MITYTGDRAHVHCYRCSWRASMKVKELYALSRVERLDRLGYSAHITEHNSQFATTRVNTGLV